MKTTVIVLSVGLALAGCATAPSEGPGGLPKTVSQS